jgi:phenylpropionate dioxygenase-like ring-hydroxylating dioxygenase large terminal subunit
MNHKDLYTREGHAVNNWYVICLSDELCEKPISRIIYDNHFALFRDENKKAVCIIDRCLHRHTHLSKGGEVVNGKLKCPYHGWEYDKTGQVTHIPSEGPEVQVERKLCAKTLPCYEQDGAIWVWTGDAEPKTEIPPWRFPHHGEKGWNHYFMKTEFTGEAVNLCENFMDVPHTVYVHKGWFRDQKFQKNPMTVETKNARVKVTYLQEKDSFSWGANLLLNPGGNTMKHTDTYIYPNITCVDYWFGDNGFVINSQITPVSSLNSVVYTYIAYKVRFLGKILKPVFSFYTRKVINQDVDIMINQGASLAWDPKTTFRSTPADEVHVCIERIRHFGESGDEEKLNNFTSAKNVEFWI